MIIAPIIHVSDPGESDMEPPCVKSGYDVLSIMYPLSNPCKNMNQNDLIRKYSVQNCTSDN